MRKLKLQVQVSVDGYIAGPKGEMDFMVWDWDEELKQYVGAITESFDCIVLGRKLAEGFIPYWAGVAAEPNNPEFPAGKKFTETHKVVFSQTLNQSPWENTVLAKGDLADEITQLKKQSGRDIIVYGGAAFVSALIRQRLIDEYHLFINPTALGAGLSIFGQLDGKQNLTLIQSKAFRCGIVALHYERGREA